MMSTETWKLRRHTQHRPPWFPIVACRASVLWLALLLSAAAAWGEATVSAVFRVHHRNAQELASVAAPLLSASGRISVDARTNSLIVIDTQTTVDRVAGLVQALDRPPVPLRIEVRFGQAESVADREAAAEGSVSGNGWQVSTGPAAPDGVHVRLRSEDRTRTETALVSVTTLSGSPAHVSVGTQIPYRQRRDRVCRRYGGCPDTVLFHQVQTGFWVTPLIAGDRIDLEIVPEIADLASGKRIRFVAASVHQAVRPGQWTEIGEGRHQQAASLTEILGVSDAGRKSAFSIFIKVERVDDDAGSGEEKQ